MKRLLLCVLLAGGCGQLIEPGHRGLYFDTHHGGLRRQALEPGWVRVGRRDRIDDFDVTYSSRKEEISTVSSDRAALELTVSIAFRPIVSQLYDLDVEVGPKTYYQEVLGPEFRTATRGVFARHSYLEVEKNNSNIENEIEAEVRNRIAGKHIEVFSVRIESVAYAPELINTIRAKLVGVEEASRRKTALEADALQQKLQLEQSAARQKLELEQAADREKLQTEAEIHRKEKERQIAMEQATIDKVQAETDAATKVSRAKAEAEAIHVLAKAHAEERRSEGTTLTPLMVQLRTNQAAYEALGKLGGSGTNIMLGDWSKVPNFLFPQLAGLHLGR